MINIIIKNMKYLISYNESIRNLMIPKSEIDIDKSTENLSPNQLLQKSIKYNYIKGIKKALENNIYKIDILQNIKYLIFSFNIKNKEIIELLLNNEQFIKILNKKDIYLIEKYVFKLHQDEEKPYEQFMKSLFDDLIIKKSTIFKYILLYITKNKNIIDILSNNTLFNYNTYNTDDVFNIDNDLILYIRKKYLLREEQILFIFKYIIEKKLNIYVTYISPYLDIKI
jgi:hypothetical protein